MINVFGGVRIEEAKQENQIIEDKEPWLAVIFSWLLAGCGHFYGQRFLRGIAFLNLLVILYIIKIWCLISPNCPAILPLIIGPFPFIVIPIISCFDIFKHIKNSNTIEFESARKENKDCWLAVFLSLILPGLGHGYLHYWKSSLGFIASKFIVFILTKDYLWLAWISWFLIPMTASIHTYYICQRFKKKNMKIFIGIIIMFSLTTFWGNIFFPMICSKSMFSASSPKGNSMEPAIQPGDIIVISNLAYFRDDPKIGDIVCFRLLDDYWNNKGNRLIKRIVAIGGETVSFNDKGLYVNGKLRIIPSSEQIAIMLDTSKAKSYQNDRYKWYRKVGYYGIAKPYLVPPNCFFVLGDNVMDSIDSRFYGAISQDTIIGKAVKTLWPIKRDQLLSNNSYHDE